MKKTVITGLVLSTVLASSLFAKSHDNKEMMENSHNRMQMQMHKKSYAKKSSHHRSGMMFLFKQLNLDEKQLSEVKKIMQNKNKNSSKLSSAFTSSSFDKNKFLQIVKNKKIDMLKNRADTLEKVYNVLNKKQKMQFKVLLDLKEEKMQKMYYKGKTCDKHFNGRG